MQTFRYPNIILILMLITNGGLGLCSTPMNPFLINIPFKGKERPAKANFMAANLSSVSQWGV